VAYRLHAPNAVGRVHLAIADLWLRVKGDHVVCYDEHGVAFGDYAAVVRQAAEASEQARREAEAQAAEARARQEAEARAQREAEERAALEARLRNLEAELWRLREGNGTNE